MSAPSLHRFFARKWIVKVFQQLTSSYLLFIVAKLGRYFEDVVVILSTTIIIRWAQKPIISTVVTPFMTSRGPLCCNVVNDHLGMVSQR